MHCTRSAGACPLHKRRQAHARLGSPDRPREADDLRRIPNSLGRDPPNGRRARFASKADSSGPNAVAVGERKIEAKHIVIATGSKPRPLPIPGAELMITSDEVLANANCRRGGIRRRRRHRARIRPCLCPRRRARSPSSKCCRGCCPALDADAVAQVRAESGRIGIACIPASR